MYEMKKWCMNYPVDKNMYRALLLDHYSEVILNAKGEVMR